ncbi:MAG: CapA family protein [Halanaeroarchaeum sp.]
MVVRIGFLGDVMLGRTVNERQRRRDVTAVWGGLHSYLAGLDGLFVNLECCLSTRGTRWERTRHAFHFRADPSWAIPALQSVGVDCCSLANNHVLDYEVPALRDTLTALEEAGIATAGAGETIDRALEPAVVTVGDLDVAVVALTDNTPEYAATETTPGTAYVEIDVGDDETRATVETALERARSTDPDLLVASLHWGPNMVETPPASFREFGRWLVDSGVDVVHGHSAHVFQGIEVHRGRPIMYDTGDVVDDYAVDDRLRNDRGFLFELRLDDGESIDLRLHPTEISDCAVDRASPAAASWCRRTMRERSEPFGTPFEQTGERLRVDLRS